MKYTTGQVIIALDLLLNRNVPLSDPSVGPVLEWHMRALLIPDVKPGMARSLELVAQNDPHAREDCHQSLRDFKYFQSELEKLD